MNDVIKLYLNYFENLEISSSVSAERFLGFYVFIVF